MFKIIQITFSNPWEEPKEPQIEELAEAPDFPRAIAVGKTFCQLIDMAPIIVAKEVATGEITVVSTWNGSAYNVRGYCGYPQVNDLLAQGKI